MLEFGGNAKYPSLPGVVALVRVLSMGQIEVNIVLMLN